MRILLVSSYLPYPLFSGGHIRLYNLMKALSKKHKITLVCEKRPYQTEEDIEAVRKICEDVITVDRKKQWSWKNIVRSGFSSYPFLLAGHELPEMKEVLRKLLMEKTFQLIHVETFYVMHNIPKTYVPIVLVEHNVEYLVYQRYAQTVSTAIRPLLLLDVLKLRRWEEYYWKKVSKLVAVSEEEKAIMKRADVEIVANGVDTTAFSYSATKTKLARKEKRVLFIGDFSWIQNRKAVTWILKDIWPRVQQKLSLDNKLVKLWIVGRQIPDELKLLGNPTVFFDENAPKETAKIFQKADILLAPITVGGGTSYKILEAMSSGVPVVTTSLGGEGINVTEKTDVCISDTTEGLADHVVQLLANKETYQKISMNARKQIERQYDWKIIAEKLDTVYLSTSTNI